MAISKLQLIDEQTSPLHRIMWAYNVDEPLRKSFDNNICAFHIGDGYFLSVAHNLRVQAGFFKSIDVEVFKKDLLYKLDGSQKLFFEQHYFFDDYTKKLYLNKADQHVIQNISAVLKQKKFDTRWVTMAAKRICTPHVVIQFKEKQFYGNDYLTSQIPAHQVFHEPEINRYTFLLELELVEAFYSQDIALYRIVNAPQEVVNKIPEIEINTDFLEDDLRQFYCLQSSPHTPIGRLLNEARIEGVLDNFQHFSDEVGGNYILEGLRYLVKGYFRFGSSGAPYLYYDAVRGKYVANAIQSEASGIQLSIKNDREGNFQYVNAIASPLYTIKDQLAKYL